MSNNKEQFSLSDLAYARGPGYWGVMIVGALIFFMFRSGCFDGTFEARKKCNNVPEFAKAQCVQCVKSGRSWTTSFGQYKSECR